MRSIRGGTGLGDALYVQAVARHLVMRGERLKVCTEWPDVFKPLGDGVVCEPFRRPGINILAHYSTRKGYSGTNQFEDCCITARIQEPVDFRLDWSVTDSQLVKMVLAPGKPVICIQMPRAPMARKDGFGSELLPNCARIQESIDMIGDRATKMLIGAGKPLFALERIDIDLSNRTTVCHMLDVASIANGFLGYVSFLVPLAESFDKPGLFIWSLRGLKSPRLFVRQITPTKILHRQNSRAVQDDCSQEELASAVETFMGNACVS